jgi:cell surface protein SprA
MDPFIGRPASYPGGSLYINLGNVSEDIMRDSRMFFENCIPSPFDPTKLDTTQWGYVPRFEQQITRAFDNDNAARDLQDVGYDGLSDDAPPGRESEHTKFARFLAQLRQKLGATNPAFLQVDSDPANDNFRFYRDSAFNGPNSDQISVLTRYKLYNNPHGNSPITAANASFTSMGTSIPESEDINRDNTLNESESYFQYRIDLKPDMKVGENYLINIQNSVTPIKMPNGSSENERWYQFKIPIQEYDHRIGGISDFRSIRFMRMFLNGWEDSVILRFASLELGRNQWRTYKYSLTTPGENLPQQNQGVTDFTVTSVSLEENGQRDPVPYAMPPGVIRQQIASGTAGTPLAAERTIVVSACVCAAGW